jgi:hypothetical protein
MPLLNFAVGLIGWPSAVAQVTAFQSGADLL